MNSMIYKDTDSAGMTFPLWCKLYKREIALQVMELIPETLRRGEDYVFNNLYLLKCRAVYISKSIYYHYRNHSASTVNSPTPDFMEQIGIAQTALRKEFLKHDWKDVLIRNLNNRTFLHLLRLWNIEMQKESDIHMPVYCFDFGKLRGERVVLYGAGKVGTDYYLQFLKTYPSRLVLWVDKKYKEIRTEQYPVCDIECLTSADYDTILIAVESERTALEIKNELTETFGIQERKLSWQRPGHYWI